MPGDDGIYEIQVRVPSNGPGTWQAPYVISHADGQSYGLVDQYGLNGQWVSLGIYRLNPQSYVWTHDGTGDPSTHCSGACRLNVDAVRFLETGVLYAPDIRYDGVWASTLTLYNNGGGLSKTLVRFLDGDGRVVCSYTPALLAHQSTSLSCLDGRVAAAIVNTSQDIVATVVQRRYFPSSSASYTGVDKPAQIIDVSLLQNGNSNWQSELFLQNTSRFSANVAVAFISSGGFQCTYVANIPYHGRHKIVVAEIGCTAGTILSAHILAAQPVAVAVTQYDSGQYRFMETEHLTATTTLYAPLVQNNNSNWVSGLSLVNAGNSDTTVSTYYYNAGGGNHCTAPSLPGYLLYPMRPLTIFPLPLSGIPNCLSVLNVRFSSGQPIAANVNQLLNGSYGASTYAAANIITNIVVLPRLFHTGGWNDALSVSNPNDQPAGITVKFYNTTGGLHSQQVFTLAAHGHQSLFAPANFIGSALVISDSGPVVASANNFLPASGTDDIGAYLGRPR